MKQFNIRTDDPYILQQRDIHDRWLEDWQVEELAEMNRQYCHTTVGGKHVIASYQYHPIEGYRLTFEPMTEFKNYFLHLPRVVRYNQGNAWLNWRGKHQKPGGITFQPDEVRCPDSVLNTWQGFAVTPQEGEIEPFLRHVYDVICDGDRRAGDWLIGFFAHLVQRPEQKPSVAVLLKSVEGTGKNSLIRPLAQILGPHCTQLNGADHIIDRFNGTVGNRLLVFADEVELDNRRTANKLKALISEPQVMLEMKYLSPDPVPNLARFIFAGNDERIINAGTRERRYLVLEVSDRYVGHPGYFKDFYQWLDNNGAAHLLHYLLSVSLAGFNHCRAPMTCGLINEKLDGMNDTRQWFYEWLCNPPIAARAEGCELGKQYREYLAERLHTDITQRSAEIRVGYLMKQLKIKKKRQDGAYMYHFPAKAELKDRFATSMDCKSSDVFS